MPISMDPPLVGISVHPQRYSFDLIRSTGEFVVNVVPYTMAKEALYCGRVSGRDVDKFTTTPLTPSPARIVRPPIIKECISHLECRLMQDIEAGDHHIFVGEILEAYVRSEHISSSGRYDPETTQILFHMGGDTFSTIGKEIITPKI
jgi:flavin reductase (DIM6/NTAB) family NADH-FMN oxidoreductase RutF